MLLIGAIASHLRPWAYSSLIKFVNCFLLGRFRARKPCQSSRKKMRRQLRWTSLETAMCQKDDWCDLRCCFVTSAPLDAASAAGFGCSSSKCTPLKELRHRRLRWFAQRWPYWDQTVQSAQHTSLPMGRGSHFRPPKPCELLTEGPSMSAKYRA